MSRRRNRIVVTGAATGVGRALCLEAARRGNEVVAIDMNDAAETVQLVEAEGGRGSNWVGDVRDSKAMRALASEICGIDGAVDIVCANAGTGESGTIDTVTPDEIRATFEVNIIGVINTIQAFLPALRRAATEGQAAVLITGSEHSLGAPPHVPPMLAYTTSKHALVGLASCLRRDLAADGIAVSLLCPSYVRTERLRGYAATTPAVAETLARYGQDGDEVARLAFDGIGRREATIVTNPVSRDFINDHYGEVIEAVRRLG